MIRPCRCNKCLKNKAWDNTQCRLCWLWHNDWRYRTLWHPTTLAEYVADDFEANGAYKPIRGFVDLVRDHLRPGLTVAELGVFDGVTTAAILPMIKAVGGRYYAIDWFNGTDESGWGVDHTNLAAMQGVRHWYRDGYDRYIYPLFLKNIRATGCDDVCVILKGKTEDMHIHIPDKSLDICFNDAAHDYVSVKTNIELYLPKMKPDGIMCGHDYTWLPETRPSDEHYLELVRAVSEKFPDVEVRCNIDVVSNIWVKRLGQS